MAGYYVVLSDERRIEREVGLGFPTYEKLFDAARRVGAVLLVRCEDFHGMDEFHLHEFAALRREIETTRAAASAESDVVTFLDSLSALVTFAESRRRSIIADAD